MNRFIKVAIFSVIIGSIIGYSSNSYSMIGGSSSYVPTVTTSVEVPSVETVGELPTSENPAALVDLILQSIQSGSWAVFMGAFIMLFIWILDKVVRIKQRVPKSAIPWIAVVLGIMANLSLWLSGSISLEQALMQSIVSGPVAIGFWEMVFKHLPKKSLKQ